MKAMGAKKDMKAKKWTMVTPYPYWELRVYDDGSFFHGRTVPKPRRVRVYDDDVSEPGVMTSAGAYSTVAKNIGLKPKDVKAAVTGLLCLAAAQVKQNGSFKLGGYLNLKLKVKPAVPAHTGVNPFTKEPCVFPARPASKTVRASPTKKLKAMVI